MPAGDDRLARVVQPQLDLLRRGEPRVTAVDRLHQVHQIARRRAVAEQQLVAPRERGRQRREPGELVARELGAGVGVGSAEGVRRPGEKLPLVVAREVDPAGRSQQLGGPARSQRTRDEVAEVEHLVDTAPGEVGHHRLERGEVAVDVGEDRETHGPE